jgi:hypothetical protein
VDNKSRYHRNFLIFNQEDSGYGSGHEPTGYAKIEVKDGRGKITVSVQNLKEEQGGGFGTGRLGYNVYILRCDDEQVCPIFIGPIPLNRNKGELEWGFDPENVAKTGNSIEKFNVIAVIAKRKESISSSIKCPLAAYKEKKINWKDKVKVLLDETKPVREEIDKEIDEKLDIYSKFQGGLESKHKDYEGVKPADTLRMDDGKNLEYHKSFNIDKKSTYENLNQFDNDYSSANIYKESETPSKKSDSEGIEFDEKNNIPGCTYNGEGCPQQAGTMGYNPCINCFANNMNNIVQPDTDSEQSKSTEGSMERLKRNLDKYFEISDPFGSRRKDYKWWKVGNPVYLNNILYQCNIKTPLLFNPLVMMSHFKYRYLIIGIYTDKIRRREYIVCGVPGVYEMDEKPFGDMCRWVQLEGNRPKYGAFGYWLVYIDPKTGNFLSLS